MVSTKHCAYRGCGNDTRYPNRESMKGTFFIPFPKPTRNPNKCRKWLRSLGRSDLTIDRVNRGTYICSKHFIGDSGPTDAHPDPVMYGESHQIAEGYTGQDLNGADETMFTNSVNSANLQLGNENNNIDYIVVEVCPENCTEPQPADDNSENTSTTPENPEDDTGSTPYEINVINAVITNEQTDYYDDSDYKAPKKPYKPSKPVKGLKYKKRVNSLKELLVTNLPTGWSCLIIDDNLCCNRQLTLHGMPVMNVIVDDDFVYTVSVFSNVLQSTHAIFEGLPEKICSKESLFDTIEFLNGFKVCEGSQEAKYIAYSSVTHPSGRFCVPSQSMRSKTCTLLMELGSSKSKLCKNCLIFRGVLNRRMTRLKKLSDGKRMKINMSRLTGDEIKRELKFAKMNLKRVKDRNSKLRQRLKTEIMRNSIRFGKKDEGQQGTEKYDAICTLELESDNDD